MRFLGTTKLWRRGDVSFFVQECTGKSVKSACACTAGGENQPCPDITEKL